MRKTIEQYKQNDSTELLNNFILRLSNHPEEIKKLNIKLNPENILNKKEITKIIENQENKEKFTISFAKYIEEKNRLNYEKSYEIETTIIENQQELLSLYDEILNNLPKNKINKYLQIA